MASINLTRDQLVERLQAQMAAAVKHDAERLAIHRKAASIDKAIRQVNADPRDRWRIVEKSPSTGRIYDVLTWTPTPVKSDLCS